ncbi:C40 family peptidase [Desulfosporosinus metallidurans]|uniref:NLP/P60 family protein n=1 Tax=Desulfosporosinus metallidurans TaxID=1888891 RepID=A0A1Q8QHK1_9FIRM|nr:C40 family peptidase [Desulfosporosinus metallidurans]OLN26801.1 NLP/P60 family protein [Desulfosporosinus metallidurans]
MLIPKKKWFSGVALASVLLSSSLTGVAPSQAAILDSQVAPKVTTVQSTVLKNPPFDVSISKVYSQIMRESFNWTPTIEVKTNVTQLSETAIVPVQEKTSAPVGKTSQAPQTAKKPSVSSQKVANVKPKQISTPQVSRGSSAADTLISRGLSLQGIPYVWGGTSLKGFDCSGFVQYVFRASGISLPRTAAEQYKLGVPVSRDELMPGDLVFFQTYAPGATDVRIYIGGGRTLGAASEGVGIHSLSESYWSKHYLGARRIR